MNNSTAEQDKLHAIKKRLAALSAAEREALLAQVKQRVEARDSLCAEKAMVPHPLTSAQQRLWVLEKFDRVKYLYHVPFILKLPANIDREKLRSAIHILCREQRQLSSYFVEAEDEVTQHYSSDFTVSIQEIALTEQLPEIVDIQENHSLADFFLQPFQLNKPPLIRFAFATANDNQYLLICCHHLIMDAWSAGLLMENLSEICARPSLTVSQDTHQTEYSDYVLWEQQQWQENRYANELAYWENQRKQRAWEVDLAADFPRCKYLSGNGYHVISHVSGKLFTVLGEFAQSHQVSVNHVVLSIFQLILARYSNQDDIIVGMPVAGRQHKLWQKTIGLFVNTCLHAIRLNYADSFTQHLAKTKMQLLADITHANVPYNDLLKYFYQQQLCAQGSSFNILYNFLQTASASKIYFAGNACQTQLCLLPMSKFDLSLHALMGADQLTLIFEYSTDLFRKVTIEQIMQDFLRYLEIFMHHAEKPMTKLLWLLSQHETNI